MSEHSNVSALTARWQAFEQHARDYARGAQRRFGGSLSDDEVADFARDAMVEAMSQNPDDDERVKRAIERSVATAVRQKKREISRIQHGSSVDSESQAWIDGTAIGGSGLASGKRKRLRCLVKDAADAWAEAWTSPPGEWAPAAAKAESLRLEAHDLCRALERDANAIEDAIQGGGLWRHPDYERGIYALLVANIAKHAREPVPEVAIVNALVRWRGTHVDVRCDQCAPGSRWIICQHTIPRFDDHGKQVGGTDLRARGTRKSRPNLQFRFGGRAAVDARDDPPANYNDTYLQRDAAASLVSEALRQCGIDSSVRHMIAEESRLELRDQIAKFTKGWVLAPNGELVEAPPKIVAPGARRKWARR